MKIERRKVECVGEFNPRTKARLVALLGLSAALNAIDAAIERNVTR